MGKVVDPDLIQEALSGIQPNESEPTTKEDIQAIHDAWAQNPDAVPEDEHNENCLRHNYYKTERGDWESLPCPVCEHRDMIAKLRSKMQSAGVTPRYLDVRFADLEKVDPVTRIQKACSREKIRTIHESGQCLLLSGPPGGGKTQLATLIAKHAILYGYSASVINLGALCVSIRDSYSRSDDEKAVTESGVVESLGNIDFLVLDDLGAGESDNAKVERRVLYLASERRQNNKKPTIITTNLTQGELTKSIGVRILNRFMPLTVINVNHGRNFRVKMGEDLW